MQSTLAQPVRGLMANTDTFDQHLAAYDLKAHEQWLKDAEDERQAFIKAFSLDHLPNMTLEEYAQGQPDNKDTFVNYVQQRTWTVAHIMLGDAKNALIYYNKKKQGWVTYWEKPPDQAWQEAKSAWINALDLAKDGEWEEIDKIAVLL